MALTRTSLTSAITPSQLVFGVASTAVGFPAVGQISAGSAFPMLIDDEMMFLVQVLSPQVIQVRSRGADGQQAQAHDVGASVVVGVTGADFPTGGVGYVGLRPVFGPDVVTYGQDGAIAVPVEPYTIAKLTKPSAGAYTLAAPSLALDGIQIYIVSTTAFAHVISAPGLFLYGGGTTNPLSTVTFLALAGAALTLTATGGFWSVDTPPLPALVTVS